MRLVNLDPIVDRVRRQAPAAPIPLIESNIIDKAIELCEAVPVWRDTDVLNFGENDPCEYLMAVPQAEIYRIETATMDGCPLERIRVEELDRRYPNWMDDKPGENIPRFVTQLSANTLRLYPANKCTVHVRLWLKPSIECDVLPSDIVSQHGTLLWQGAAGEILLMPDAELANPQLGARLLAKFESGLDTLRTNHTRTQLRAPLRTKPSFM